MLVGVGLAVVASVVVGVGLDVLSTSLPQRQQEMLETVIGLVAVVFVTTMIIWMNRNAFGLKGELEHDAARAINSGGSMALATMAFLAVLKEGFETAVFLLAAAQATHGSGWAALFGGVAGIAVAIGIGIGIYFGGLKLNLGRFFRITGVFLIFIAAGLVTGALRTAHEAGWVNIGQLQVFDFSSWMPSRSILGALITGMFGIPSDPRLIEVLGWLLYALPVLVIFLWPATLAAAPSARRKLLAGVAALLTAAALALALLVPAEGTAPPGPSRTATRVDGGTVTVTFTPNGEPPSLTVEIPGDDAPPAIPLRPAGTQSVDGVEAQVWQTQVETDPKITAATATLKQLADLTGGRLPVGLGTARTPGPFQARWTATTSYNVVTHGNSMISAQSDGNRVAVLSGGGISGSKTVSLGTLGNDWETTPVDDNAVAATIARSGQDHAERALWRSWLPILLAAAAAVTAVIAVRTGRSSPTSEERQHNNHDGHDETARTDEINVA
ncbi:MAG: high-affinity iron transporter [Mycobacterium sp.]|jgi:high-affinity iron transporter|nr:high-affinity iron transporter [Mycobacterium sp.]